MSNRLNQLSQQLILSEPPIEVIRRQSTIDRQELKQLAYGPNFMYRDRVFEMVLNHRDVFDHSFLLEYDRKTMRKKSAEQLLLFNQVCPLTFQEYLKNPNALSAITNAFSIYEGSLCVLLGVHLRLYCGTIFNLGLK